MTSLAQWIVWASIALVLILTADLGARVAQTLTTYEERLNLHDE